MVLETTALPLIKEEIVEKTEEEKCIAKGGKWNGTSCVMPTEETTPKTETSKTQTMADGTAITSKNVSPEEYEAYRVSQGFTTNDSSSFGALNDAESGRLSGFEKGGETYLGVSPSEVRTELEKEANLQELAVGGQAESVLSSRQQGLQNTGLDLSAQVGDDPLTELQSQFSAQEVSYVGALASAVPGIVPNLISGAAAGGGTVFGLGAAATAVTGAAAAPVAGTSIAAVAAITGIANVVRGFYSEFVSDVKRQKGELIETPIRTLTETKSILNDVISAQNANPADAQNNLEAFNSQLQLLDDEYDRLKDLTDDDLNAFLGDTGINQLQEYEVYFIENGERDRQIAEMQIALANPDITRVNPSTVTIEQINARIAEELSKLQ